jgi:hypothetical protein
MARNLTSNERSLLEWLLGDSRITEAATLRAQIPHAYAVKGIPDLPTYLHLTVRGAPPANVDDGRLPGGAVVLSPSGEATGGLILWAASGYLESVEHWWVTDEMPLEFPSVDRLRPFAPEEDYSTARTDRQAYRREPEHRDPPWTESEAWTEE